MKSAQLRCSLLLLLCSTAIVLLTARATETESSENSHEIEGPGVIAIKYKFRWESLWDSQASLEEVTAEERSEYIDEALMEIASKLKRKQKIKTMSKYDILEYKNDEHILVQYPNLRSLEADRPMND